MKQLVSLQKISVSVICFLLPHTITGIGYLRPSAGAGEAGMAYTCVMKPGLWSSFYNQAGLPLYRSAAMGFSYENRFSLKELGTRSACLIIPSNNGAIGAIYSCFGYSDYKRETAGIASGLNLTQELSAGVQVECLIEKTAGDYRNYIHLTCEAGVMFKISENTRVGVHIFNPVPNSLRNVSVPSALRTGAGITLNHNLFAGIEAEMISYRKMNLKTGFEYAAARNLYLRGGYSTLLPSFSFGIGYTVKPAIIDLAFSTHPKLGITSNVSVSFIISRGK